MIVPFRLSQRLSPALESVRPDALFVVKRAIKITPEDFIVFDGVRTLERQRERHAQKRKTPCERVTQTLTSNQQTPRRLWRAVDLSPPPVEYEGPAKFPTQAIEKATKAAAFELGVRIEAGRRSEGLH